MVSEWVPALNEELKGDCQIYFIEGERGQNKESLGMFWIWKSRETRDKYWPGFQESSEAWKTIFNKLQPLYQKFTELGEFKAESKHVKLGYAETTEVEIQLERR